MVVSISIASVYLVTEAVHLARGYIIEKGNYKLRKKEILIQETMMSKEARNVHLTLNNYWGCHSKVNVILKRGFIKWKIYNVINKQSNLLNFKWFLTLIEKWIEIFCSKFKEINRIIELRCRNVNSLERKK